MRGEQKQEMILDRFRKGQATEEEEQILKKKIRTVMEQLICQEDLETMEEMETRGWFGRYELERFIRYAGNRRRPLSLMWLLHLKNEKYGYKSEDFGL